MTINKFRITDSLSPSGFVGRKFRVPKESGLSWDQYWSVQWYGVEINEASSSPDLTRIYNNKRVHSVLPVHSLIKGCLLLDNGTVNYYLDPDDWSKKADGTPSDLTGADGNVMIEIPAYYRRVDNPSAGVYQHKISLSRLSGYEYVPKFYVGAYKSTVNRTPTIKQWSVKNTTAEYRGGNNNPALDLTDKTQLGKPASDINLSDWRNYARARSAYRTWSVIPYRHSLLLYELFFIEYATLNSQKAVDATLTVDGYKKGGLGNGVTTVNQTTWNTFNGIYPLIPCGASDSLANGTGEITYSVPGFGDASGIVKVNRYRGIEDPFGDIYEICDGANVYHEGVGGNHKFYVCEKPPRFYNGTQEYYNLVGNLPASDGYIDGVIHDVRAVMIPKTSGGSNSTYFCDYYDTSGLTSSWSILMKSGAASNTTMCGMLIEVTAIAAGAGALPYVGTRLAYLPNIDYAFTMVNYEIAPYASKRTEIISRIFTGGFPANGIDGITVGVAEPMGSSSGNLASIDRLLLHIAGIADRTPYLWHPIISNNKFVIYHMGHFFPAVGPAIYEQAGEGNLIRALIDEGYTVCAVYLPPSNAGVEGATHSYPVVTPPYQVVADMHYFLETTIRIINEYEGSFTEFFMTGISGGGNMTAYVSALDERIRKSAPICSPLPSIAMDTKGIGNDWEQDLPGLWDLIEVGDLFAMSVSSNRQCKQYLVRNEVAPGFNEDTYNYAPYIFRMSLITNDFELIWDDTTTTHEISANVRDQVVAFFNS